MTFGDRSLGIVPGHYLVAPCLISDEDDTKVSPAIHDSIGRLVRHITAQEHEWTNRKGCDMRIGDAIYCDRTVATLEDAIYACS